MKLAHLQPHIVDNKRYKNGQMKSNQRGQDHGSVIFNHFIAQSYHTFGWQFFSFYKFCLLFVAYLKIKTAKIHYAVVFFVDNESRKTVEFSSISFHVSMLEACTVNLCSCSFRKVVPQRRFMTQTLQSCNMRWWKKREFKNNS